MYIEKRLTKKGTKFYLTCSIRGGKKVQKIRKFLGIGLSASALAVKRKKAERLILEELKTYKKIGDLVARQELKERRKKSKSKK